MARAGSGRVTAADIGRALGISRATVGYVLNNTPGQVISERTRQRVLAEAERQGYRPHAHAQALASGRSKTMLLVLPNWPLAHSMTTGLDAACDLLDRAGYHPVVYTHRAGESARPPWEALDPVVVLNFGLFDSAELAAMRASGTTAIVPDLGGPQLGADAPITAAGTRLQVRHLVDLGHRELAVATSTDPQLAGIAGVRAEAARRAAVEFGLAAPETVLVDHRDDSANAAARRWRARGVTGVVAYNDDIAATVIGAALDMGISVPQHLSVIGHDDSLLAHLYRPTITSVDLDVPALARHLARLALHAADSRNPPPEPPNLTPRLHPRASTGEPFEQGRDGGGGA